MIKTKEFVYYDPIQMNKEDPIGLTDQINEFINENIKVIDIKYSTNFVHQLISEDFSEDNLYRFALVIYETQ